MRVFNKWAHMNSLKLLGIPKPSSKHYAHSAHMCAVERRCVKMRGVFSDCSIGSLREWESECTAKEYHLMWNAKKARVRKKYRNRVERRI